MSTSFRNSISLLFVYGSIGTISGILLASLFVQFVLGEFPCPLCMTQRITFILCILGQMFIISRIDNTGSISLKDFVTGHGMTLLAAVGGATMSIRHILLHIVPPDPGYGAAFMGLHMYTWAFLAFSCQIIAVAISLMVVPANGLRVPDSLHKPTRLLFKLVAVVILAFALGTFIEEGFHWVLPHDPVENQLLKDIQNLW